MAGLSAEYRARSSYKGFTWLRSCQRDGSSPEQSGCLRSPLELHHQGMVRQPRGGELTQLTHLMWHLVMRQTFGLGTQVGAFWHLGRRL